jgi:hypothetical protein
MDLLYELVGPYKIYSDDLKGVDYASEDQMKLKVIEKFGKYKFALSEALQCEDYEQEGILDLTQLQEAILSVEDDLDDHLLDYMLYYVYARNEHAEKFEYKVLLSLLDEEIAPQKKKKPERIQSAKPKVTSSDDNQKLIKNFKDIVSSNSDEQYSEVED